MSKPTDAAVVQWIIDNATEDVREPGWLTIAEIAEASGTDFKLVRAALERGARDGDVKKKIARVTDSTHRIRPTAVYYVPGADNGKAEPATNGRGRRGRDNAAKAP